MKILSFTVILLYCISAHSEVTLSYEETLGLISYFPDTSLERVSVPKEQRHLFINANPKSLSRIHELFSKGSLSPKEKNNLIKIIGYIGDSNSVNLLKKFLQSLKGNLEGYEKKYIQSITDALALLEKRNTHGAKEILDSLCSKLFWEKSGIKILPPNAPHGNINELLVQSVWALRLTERNDNNIKDIFTSILKSVPQNSQKYMQFRLDFQRFAQARENAKLDEKRKVTKEELHSLSVLSQKYLTKEAPETKKLTKSETLGLVVYDFHRIDEIQLFKASSHQALDVLSQILSHKKLPQNLKSNIIYVLGYIGNEGTIKNLNQLIITTIDSPQYDKKLIQSLFDALAILEKRKTQGAKETLDSIISRPYWEKISSQNNIKFNIDKILEQALWSLRFSGRNDESISQYLKTYFERISEDNKKLSVKNLNLKLIQDVRSRIKSNYKNEITSKQRDTLNNLFNNFLKIYSSLRISETEIFGKDKEDLIKIAQAQIVLIKKYISAGDQLLDNFQLIDNGKIISKAKVQSNTQEYLKDLKKQESIFKALKATTIFSKTNVFKKIDLNTEEPLVSYKIFLEIPDTAKIVKKEFRRPNFRSETFSKERNLVFVFQLEKQIWAWQPFGW